MCVRHDIKHFIKNFWKGASTLYIFYIFKRAYVYTLKWKIWSETAKAYTKTHHIKMFLLIYMYVQRTVTGKKANLLYKRRTVSRL